MPPTTTATHRPRRRKATDHPYYATHPGERKRASKPERPPSMRTVFKRAGFQARGDAEKAGDTLAGVGRWFVGNTNEPGQVGGFLAYVAASILALLFLDLLLSDRGSAGVAAI